MKWKIVRRYIAAMMITTFIVISCLWTLNIINALTIFFNKDKIQTVDLYNNDVSQYLFSENFCNNFKWDSNGLKIDEKHLNNLKEYGIWLQVLDNNATEVYSRFRPSGFPTHYSPNELVDLYSQSSTIKGYCLFVEPYKKGEIKYSYVLAFPYTISERRIFTYNPSTFKYDLFMLAFVIILVTGVIMFLVSYIFSINLAQPVIMIIDNIKALSVGDYRRKFPAFGIYSDVNKNLSTLSDTLAKSETERNKNEQLREEWIANITHDLKTPLSSIKGYAEIMLDSEYKLSEDEIKRYISIILDKSNYLEGLTEDLKLTYKLKSTDLTEGFKVQNIVAIIREAIIDIMNTPKYENADISFEASDENIFCRCDSKLIIRALENIIYNSLVHTPENTQVKVSILLDSCININIEDNGSGIPEDELERLFDRYYRGTGTGETHKGSGLGLAIAKQVIVLHSGSIEAFSYAGAGTSIRIVLPVSHKLN